MGGSGGDYLCRRSFSVFRSTWDVIVVAYERPWSGVYATDLDVVLGAYRNSVDPPSLPIVFWWDFSQAGD